MGCSKVPPIDSPTTTAVVSAPQPCSVAALEAFDPGAPVVKRHIEEVMRAATISRQERMVITRCRRGESADRCIDRGRTAALEKYPDANVSVERERVSRRKTQAVATAVLDPGRDAGVEELRMRLVVEAGANAERTLARRAEESSLTISSVKETQDGRLASRLSCSRPVSDTVAGSTKGVLDGDAIKRHVRREQARVNSCYSRVKSDYRGRIVVDFAIGEDGSVTSASAVKDSGASSGRVSTCVAEKVRKFRFPAKKGRAPVLVRHAFVVARPGAGVSVIRRGASKPAS